MFIRVETLKTVTASYWCLATVVLLTNIAIADALYVHLVLALSGASSDLPTERMESPSFITPMCAWGVIPA